MMAQGAGKRPFASADIAEVEALLRPELEAAYGRWALAEGSAHDTATWYRILVDAVRQEADTLDEMVRLAEFALTERVTRFAPEAREALDGEWVPAVLARSCKMLSAAALVTPLAANEYFRELRHYFRDTLGLRGKQVMFPLRAALTGSMVGPCLGVVGSLLGLERCLRRLEDVER